MPGRDEVAELTPPPCLTHPVSTADHSIQGSVSSKDDILKIKDAFAAAGETKLDVLVNWSVPYLSPPDILAPQL